MQSAITDNTNWGLQYVGAKDSEILQSFVGNNGNGVRIARSDRVALAENAICSNTGKDVSAANSMGLGGSDNQCDTASGWNDQFASGCTYACVTPGTLIVAPVLVLPNPDTILRDRTRRFSWNTGPDAKLYWLQVSRLPGLQS